MGMRFVTHYGLRFIIDTSDWGPRSATGEKAADHLQEWLESLGEHDARHLHRALLSGDESNLWNVSALTMGQESRDQAMSEDGWAEMPDDGHNCYLSAGA